MSYLSEDQINNALSDHISAFEKLVVDCRRDIQRALEAIIQTFQVNGKLLIIGNGGSAADAQHIAAELTGRFLIDRKGLPAIACTTDTSVLTSIGNDFGYEILFERQVEALGKPEDSLISISTSGNSINVLRATQYASSIGMSTIGMTGKMGGKLADLVDICIKAPSTSTPRIQEVHGFIGHLLCAGVDDWVAQQKI